MNSNVYDINAKCKCKNKNFFGAIKICLFFALFFQWRINSETKNKKYRVFPFSKNIYIFKNIPTLIRFCIISERPLPNKLLLNDAITIANMSISWHLFTNDFRITFQFSITLNDLILLFINIFGDIWANSVFWITYMWYEFI